MKLIIIFLIIMGSLAQSDYISDYKLECPSKGKLFGQKYENISPEESKLIGMYTSDLYTIYNAVRVWLKTDETCEDTECLIKKTPGVEKLTLNEALKQFFTDDEDIKEWVKTLNAKDSDSFEPILKMIINTERALKKLETKNVPFVQRALSGKYVTTSEGSIFFDKAFMSTSKDMHFDFIRSSNKYKGGTSRAQQLLKIKTISKSKGKLISQISCVTSEDEVLFPPMTKFCVEKIIEKLIPKGYSNIGKTRDVIYMREMTKDEKCEKGDTVFKEWKLSK